ncbi:hypothetical protein ACF0H5_023402 [Mactra antiquata]
MRNSLIVIFVLLGCTFGFKHRRFIFDDLTMLECTRCKCALSCHVGESEDNPGICRDLWDKIECGDYLCKVFDCNHRGKCEMNDDQPVCHCEHGYSGTHCEINHNQTPAPDACLSSPCVNGQCTSITNGYQCACASGWTGYNCDIDNRPLSTSAPNACLSSPCVNGQCTSVTNGYQCACSSGWSGTNCDIAPVTQAPDVCATNPCVHGTCSSVGNDYTCSCENGWTGSNCETAVLPCDSNPCKNGGKCLNLGVTFTCACPSGWSGATCEKNAIPHCQDICALEAVATVHSVFNDSASKCSDNTKGSNEAMPMTCCGLDNQQAWLRGIQVTSHCSGNAQIPSNTPIASFMSGRPVDDTAGVFLNCDANGFKYVRQACDSAPHIIDVDGSGLDPASFYVIY